MPHTLSEFAQAAPMFGERRRCAVTESKLNVAVIFRTMLGPDDAMAYLLSSRVPAHLLQRVILHPEQCRKLPGVEVSAAQLRLVE